MMHLPRRGARLPLSDVGCADTAYRFLPFLSQAETFQAEIFQAEIFQAEIFQAETERVLAEILPLGTPATWRLLAMRPPDAAGRDPTGRCPTGRCPTGPAGPSHPSPLWNDADLSSVLPGRNGLVGVHRLDADTAWPDVAHGLVRPDGHLAHAARGTRLTGLRVCLDRRFPA